MTKLFFLCFSAGISQRQNDNFMTQSLFFRKRIGLSPAKEDGSQSRHLRRIEIVALSGRKAVL
jgi:hypothetical protein